ncbi:DUF2065 domain-containing protein [Oceanobacter mangrovi]|uniref:DUF2065 domain-containing protein n=1 Tax=Oceanobacter mangrovi TaxID=2862510 RepID=UPI001C8E90C5|nr:DUF2065 family protein [Oceanobacter mangrovi]
MTLWQELTVAICLVFVLEGLMPFLLPAQWRRWVVSLADADTRTIRMTGLFSMLLGVGLLYLIH